ncbi:MAG: hypothetical protein ABI823_07585, partial [Bryobacteraceae bacterium]
AEFFSFQCVQPNSAADSFGALAILVAGEEAVARRRNEAGTYGAEVKSPNRDVEGQGADGNRRRTKSRRTEESIGLKETEEILLTGENANWPASKRPVRLEDSRASVDRSKGDPADRLEALLELVEGKLESGDFKASILDWVRLTELVRERRDEGRSNEVRVTWITPTPVEVEEVFGPRKRDPEGGRDKT